MKLLIDNEVWKPENVTAKDVERLCNPWFETDYKGRLDIKKNKPIDPTLFERIEILLSVLMCVCKHPETAAWFVEVTFSETGGYRVSASYYAPVAGNSSMMRGFTAIYLDINTKRYALHKTAMSTLLYKDKIINERITVTIAGSEVTKKRLNITDYMRKVMDKKLKSSKK